MDLKLYPKNLQKWLKKISAMVKEGHKVGGRRHQVKKKKKKNMCNEKKMEGLQLSTENHDFSDLPKPYPYTLKNSP